MHNDGNGDSFISLKLTNFLHSWTDLFLFCSVELFIVFLFVSFWFQLDKIQFRCSRLGIIVKERHESPLNPISYWNGNVIIRYLCIGHGHRAHWECIIWVCVKVCLLFEEKALVIDWHRYRYFGYRKQWNCLKIMYLELNEWINEWMNENVDFLIVFFVFFFFSFISHSLVLGVVNSSVLSFAFQLYSVSDGILKFINTLTIINDPNGEHCIAIHFHSINLFSTPLSFGIIIESNLTFWQSTTLCWFFSHFFILYFIESFFHFNLIYVVLWFPSFFRNFWIHFERIKRYSRIVFV